MKLAAEENRTVYEADLALWAQKTADAIWRGDFRGIDLERVAEECGR